MERLTPSALLLPVSPGIGAGTWPICEDMISEAQELESRQRQSSLFPTLCVCVFVPEALGFLNFPWDRVTAVTGLSTGH